MEKTWLWWGLREAGKPINEWHGEFKKIGEAKGLSGTELNRYVIELCKNVSANRI